MKFLVVSDIHGSADYTKKALEAYALHKPDQILLLGDILYHGRAIRCRRATIPRKSSRCSIRWPIKSLPSAATATPK